MIPLNTDYSDIRRQLFTLKDGLCRNMNDTDVFSYVQSWDVLYFVYFLSTGMMVDNGRFKQDKILYQKASERNNVIRNRYHQNFLNHKAFHAEMFSSFYFEAVDILDDFYSSNYYQKLISSYYPVLDFKNDEDLDLLFQFFREEAPELADLFSDLLKSGHLYRLNPSLDRDGLTIFNSFDNICNVFVRERVSSVEFLATIIHELAHVLDYFDYGLRFSRHRQKLYSVQNLYVEVFSTLYQQKFYEFLIKNGVRKDETTLNVARYFDSYITGVGDAILFSMLPDEYYRSAVSGEFTRDYMVSLIGEDICASSSADYTPLFDESLKYTYGIMIANSIIHDKKKYDEFLNIRSGYFDARNLMTIGITPEEMGKQMIKNMQNFIS